MATKIKHLQDSELLTFRSVMLRRKEPSIVACCRCKDVFKADQGKMFTDTVYAHLGRSQDYYSVHEPVSGWITCPACRARLIGKT